MARYVHKPTGQVSVTVDGSYHDRRLKASDEHVTVPDGADPADVATAVDDSPKPPGAKAGKDAWVDYAVDTFGWDRSDADALTIAELRKLFGGS